MHRHLVQVVARHQYVNQVAKLNTADAVRDMLDFCGQARCCLVIDGESLQVSLVSFRDEFIELATQLSAVVACRCSPTQKADVARADPYAQPRMRVCCIGDGGNDVSMIQAATYGLGIVGKEGSRRLSPPTFSITQFSFLTKLLVWHGRNSYKRSASWRCLSSTAASSSRSASRYSRPSSICPYRPLPGLAHGRLRNRLHHGARLLTRARPRASAKTRPPLPGIYQGLTKGSSLSAKTFTTWLMISTYQGGAFMILVAAPL